MQHTNAVMIVLTTCAIILAIVPFKLLLAGVVLHGFLMTSKLGKRMQNERGNRRMKEWWDSIPIIPVEVVDKDADRS